MTDDKTPRQVWPLPTRPLTPREKAELVVELYRLADLILTPPEDTAADHRFDELRRLLHDLLYRVDGQHPEN